MQASAAAPSGGYTCTRPCWISPAQTRRAGLKPDTRAYRPHVTLAYLRHADPAQAAHWVQANSLLKSPPIPIDRFGLYSSHQTKDGSAYRLEAEYPLI